MNIPVVCLYLASSTTFLVGAVMCLAAAFHRSWDKAKNGVLTCLAGFSAFAGLSVTMPFAKALHPTASAPSHREKMKELDSKIEEQRNHIEALQDNLAKATNEAGSQYKELSTRRAALGTADQTAVHQFNLDAANYQKQVAQLNQLKQEITAANTEVDDLLSQRTEEAAKKEVVIFSTSWCPACKAAKQYMDSKGISYRDVDVEKSPEGAEEYRSEGGTGSVLLIVVGDKKMLGFNSAQLDSML